MRRLRVTDTAALDIAHILMTSRREFGRAAQTRYRALFEQARNDLRENPERVGVVPLEGSTLHLYHLRHSKRRLPHASRVAAPRHILAFKFNDRFVEIVRVLHDAMDLESQLEPNTDQT